VRKKTLIILSLILVLSWQMVMPYHRVTLFHKKEVGLAKKLNHLMDNLLAADQSDFSLAVSTVGLVGYRLMGHTIIDMLGLTDSTIARHPEPAIEGLETTWRENKYNSAYLLSRQPDYFLFSTGIKASAPAERALFMYSRFLDNYRTIPFYFSNELHQVYKRYYPIASPVERDIDVKFEQNYNHGIRLWSNGDYSAALAAFHDAKKYSPSPVYPYLNYFIMLTHKINQNASPFIMTLNEIMATDTLVVEAYIEMYYIEKSKGNEERTAYFHRKIESLAPWYLESLE
jgi:hypothetical protein